MTASRTLPLKGISQLARPGALLTILINISVFENHDYCQKLGLPQFDIEKAKPRLVSRYREVGIDLKRVQVLDQNVPHQTTWGQKLTKGSGSRRTLFLEGMIR